MKNIMQETVCPHFNSSLCNILAFNSALFVQLFHKNKDTNTIFIKQKKSINEKHKTNPRSGITNKRALAAYIFIAHIHTADTSTYHETMTHWIITTINLWKKENTCIYMKTTED